MVYVSTGHIYAQPTVGLRVDEEAPVGPRSVYARTKLEAEVELTTVAASHGVPLVCARVFGIVAPRQPENYVLQGLIDRIRQGRIEGVPGLDNVRDYLDARDVCASLVELRNVTLSSDSTIVNVCSGDAVSIRDLMIAVAEEEHDSPAADAIREVEPGVSRADDIPWLVGDPSRFVALTGVAPRKRPLRESVRDALAEVKAKRR